MCRHLGVAILFSYLFVVFLCVACYHIHIAYYLDVRKLVAAVAAFGIVVVVGIIIISTAGGCRRLRAAAGVVAAAAVVDDACLQILIIVFFSIRNKFNWNIHLGLLFSIIICLFI